MRNYERIHTHRTVPSLSSSNPSPALPRQVNTAPPPQHVESGLPPVGPSSDQNSRLVARTFAVYGESHKVDQQPRQMLE